MTDRLRGAAPELSDEAPARRAPTSAALCRHLARPCVVAHPFMPGKVAEVLVAITWQDGDPGACRFAHPFRS